ncbi:GtrA family protein [Flexivirga sp. B27]
MIGVASTLANVVLFYLLNLTMNAQVANALSLIITTIFNTAANRRFTFGVRSRGGAARAQLQGLVLWLIMWAATALALFLLLRASPDASHTAQSVVQLVGNVVATVIRFVMLRRWFAPQRTVAAQE